MRQKACTRNELERVWFRGHIVVSLCVCIYNQQRAKFLNFFMAFALKVFFFFAKSVRANPTRTSFYSNDSKCFFSSHKRKKWKKDKEMGEPKRKRTEETADSALLKKVKKAEGVKKPTSLHRCRFVTQTPTAVNLIAVEPSGQQRYMAVVREDNTIEIRETVERHWQRLNSFRCFSGNIQAVVWAKELSTKLTFSDDDAENSDAEEEEEAEKEASRLFTGSADGHLQEWDVTRGCIKVSSLF